MRLCKVCAQSDILCPACSRKVESGEISKAEVELVKAMHNLGKDSDYSVEFLEAIENRGRIYVIVDSKHAGKFIGPGGRNIRKLSEIIGRPVKMLEKTTGSEKHVIEKLIGSPVIGISKVYESHETPKERHTHVEWLKVRVDRKHIKNIKPLEGVVSNIINKKVKIIAE